MLFLAKILIACIMVTMVDTLSGVFIALKNNEFKSKKFKYGCLIKFGQVILICLSIPINYYTNLFLEIDLPLSNLIAIQFIIQEGSSIYENYKKLGSDKNG